ncbi:MAG: RsiV family protein [Tannerella sp.]|uniref:RsiV family protein n=1 Tax=Tannerella sp. TaxID=2382127 RepID=UPI003FA2F7B1
MKIYIVKTFFVWLVAVGLLSACGSDAKKVKENDIRFDTMTLKESYHMKNIETNPGCSLQINFLYPAEYQNQQVLKAAQQQFIRAFLGDDYMQCSPREAVSLYAVNYLNDFKKRETDFESDVEEHGSEPNDEWYSSYEILSDSIYYNQNDLLSMVVSKEYDTGGAHNAHHYTNRVIDLRTGERVTEAAVFIEDYQDDLAKIIVDVIALYNNVDKASDLENIGFFNINEIYPNKNFYVDEVGITYTFNEYEIAAYVVGATSVRIPYEKIRHLLRKESPIAHIAF